MAEDHEKDQPETPEEVAVPGGMRPPRVVGKPREQLEPSPTEWQPASSANALQLILLSVIATLLLVGVLLSIVWVLRSGDGPVAAETPSPMMVAQQEDTGPTDTGPTDTGPTDTGPTDTGPTDTGPTDTGPTDTETVNAEPEADLGVVLVSLSLSPLTADAVETGILDQLQTVLGKLQDADTPMSSADRRRIHSWLRTIPLESVKDIRVKQRLFDIRAWSWYNADYSASLDRFESSDRGFSDSVLPQVSSPDSLGRFVHEFILSLVIAQTPSGVLLLGTCLTAEPPAASMAPPSTLTRAEQDEWNYCSQKIEQTEDDLDKAVYHYRLADLCVQAAGRVPSIDSEGFEVLIETGLEHFRQFEQYSHSIRGTKGASLIPTTVVQECRSKLLLAHRIVLVQKAAQEGREFPADRVQQIANQVVGDFAREEAEAKIRLTSSDTALLDSLEDRIEALDEEPEKVKLLTARVAELRTEGPEVSLGRFVLRSSEIAKLLQEVHQLEREQIPPSRVLLTRQELVQFLERLRLPSRLEELNPAAPPSVPLPPDSLARLRELWQGMRDDVGLMEATIAGLSGDTASVPVAQAPEVRGQMDRILYAAVQLETVRLLPVSVEPGHVQKHSPADFWRDMYQLSDQIQRLEEQGARSSEGQRENTALVASVRTELRQLRAVQMDEQGQMQAAQQRLGELQQELRSTLTAQIDQALSQPRALPPDQLQKVRDEVVERLLTEMATYGYTPPADSTGGQAAPRVEPLADQPNPIWAEELYGRGCTAYFGSRFDQSIGYFSQAVRNDPRNPVYHYFLGLSLYQSGRMEEATAQVKAARRLELSNGSRQVNSALHRVQGPARIWLEEVRLRS